MNILKIKKILFNVFNYSYINNICIIASNKIVSNIVFTKLNFKTPKKVNFKREKKKIFPKINIYKFV